MRYTHTFALVAASMTLFACGGPTEADEIAASLTSAGFPEENIQIEDGTVYINGQTEVTPDIARNISRYDAAQTDAERDQNQSLRSSGTWTIIGGETCFDLCQATCQFCRFDRCPGTPRNGEPCSYSGSCYEAVTSGFVLEFECR